MASETAATTTETMVAAEAVDSTGTGPPHLGEPLQQDGSNLHDGAFKGTGLCFHHYSYGRQATRCKPPCLFNQGNRAAAGNNCLKCQRGKVHRHVRLRSQHVAVPAQRFSHIHVDLVGPLPASKGATYVFIDSNTV
jgi:hypothetical protein